MLLSIIPGILVTVSRICDPLKLRLLERAVLAREGGKVERSVEVGAPVDSSKTEEPLLLAVVTITGGTVPSSGYSIRGISGPGGPHSSEMVSLEDR